MFVFVFVVFSVGRDLCDGLMTPSEESQRCVCVCVCVCMSMSNCV